MNQDSMNIGEDKAESILWRGLQQNDPRACQLVFETVVPMLINQGRRDRLTYEDAEDVAQQTLVSLFQFAASGGRVTETLESLVFGIFRNKVLDHLRAKRGRAQQGPRAATVELPEDGPPAKGPTLLDEVIVRERGSLVRWRVDQLEPRDRELVDLIYFQNKTFWEASAILGVPAGTLKCRMHLIRRKLAEDRVLRELAAV